MEAGYDRLYRVIHGNPDNPQGAPGVIAEQRQLAFKVDRTNEILEDVRGDIKDVRGDIRKIGWLVISLVIAAVLNTVFKR